MTDIVDLAAGLEAEHIARSLASVNRAIAAGVAGECEECGEDMPRLVGGRCGYCRDGRRPPLSRFDGPVPAVASPALEEETMPTPSPTKHAQTVSVPASGAALVAIRELAASDDLPLGRAALALIERAIATPAQAMDAQPVCEVSSPRDLQEYSSADLLDELRERLNSLGDVLETEAAIARAEAAEARLAQIRAVFGGDQAEG